MKDIFNSVLPVICGKSPQNYARPGMLIARGGKDRTFSPGYRFMSLCLITIDVSLILFMEWIVRVSQSAKHKQLGYMHLIRIVPYL
jgi:hypothetical protein